MKNIFTLLSVFFYFLSIVTAQEVIWQKTIGGGDDDELIYISKTIDGGYIIGGTSKSDSSGDKTENTNGVEDYWIVKTDSMGNIQWQNTIGGSEIDNLSKVKQTNDGGYIIGGTSFSGLSGDKTEDSFLSLVEDIWIVKTDALGNIQWQNTIGGKGTDRLNDLHQTQDGGYILGTASASDTSIDKSENKIGSFDYWIIKIDSLGNIQWENTIGGTGADYLISIQQTNDGGYILGGNSNSTISGDKTEDSLGSGDYWIVKTDNAGNIVWQNTIGGNSIEVFNSIEQTNDGGYILGGISTSPVSGDKTESNYSGSDLWIVKIDSLGIIQWQNNIGAGGPDLMKGVQQTFDNGYIISSWKGSGISGEKTETGNGSTDYWILKLDSSGNIDWQRSIGGNAQEEIGWIVQESNGKYFLAGNSESDISGDKTENSKGLQDFWIVRISEEYNAIKGKSFIDLNSNSIRDSGEISVSNHIFRELNSDKFAYSKEDGSYAIYLLDTGNLTVNPDTFPYYSAVPVQHSVYFNGILQTDSLNDFAFQPAGLINDLQIDITATNTFRPGFNGYYNLHYKNTGNTSLSSTIIFFPDSGISYDTSSVIPDLISADSIVWQISPILPFDENNILITVKIDSSLTLGTIINSSAKVEPILGDTTPVDNYSLSDEEILGSFDPNDILVNRKTILTTELISPPFLVYTIRFQNTGTDTAFNVKIINTLPENTDHSTFEFLESTHPVNLNYFINSKTMWFEFNNIQLPDSNVNEPLSHGFVKYRIKPLSTLIAGIYINNIASIYFDYNMPVQTNQISTRIILPVFVQEINDKTEFSVFPNPSTTELYIDFKLEKPELIQLDFYNSMGQKIKTIEQKKYPSGRNIIPIPISEFENGFYYISLLINNKIISRKIVKM